MTRGGARANAGRPKGSGIHGEPTKVIRVPLSKVDQIHELIQDNETGLPLYTSKVSAGFPSPAEDYKEGKIDLNSYLIKRPASTFFVRATGDSMINAGIFPDDLLIVDRSITPVSGKVIIAVIDGELTVKRLRKKGNSIILDPENPKYKSIVIKEGQAFSTWGVVTNVIHPL